MDFILDIAAFVLKAGIVLVFFAVLIGYLVQTSSVGKKSKSRIKFIDLKMQKLSIKEIFEKTKVGKVASSKADKSKDKKEERASIPVYKNTLFVLKFDGDASATTETGFDHEVSAVISAANEGDEVAIILKSPGGYVHAYGLATEHIKRLKDAGLTVTVCVDEIAASGGYMMAAVADKIVAAPFSVIGSVGVVSEFPNFNGLLEKHGIDYKQYTAGEYKRTVGMMSAISEDAESKFKKDLERTHELFKNHIQLYRPNVNIEEIATGETWYGSEALDKGLIDSIGTSNKVIQEIGKTKNLYFVRNEPKKALGEKISDILSVTASKTVTMMNSKMIQNTRSY